MSPEEDRRLYLQHMFTGLRHYCLSVTGKVHVYTYPGFFEKYDVLKPHIRDYGGFKLVALNLADEAVKDMEFCEDGIFFSARFNGVAHEFYVPFEMMLGLTNCRDGVIHRISIAATASFDYGVGSIVMMDYSQGQVGASAYTEPKGDAPPKEEVKSRERPSLKVVK